MSQDSRPPTDYYNITVYNTTDCINSCIVYNDTVTDTNITITGLSPTINYTITIIPVNIIGYGSSANINGTVKITVLINIILFSFYNNWCIIKGYIYY